MTMAARVKSTRPGQQRLPQSRTAATCARGIDLWAYLDGELTPARTRAVAGHVVTCGECATQARRLRAMLEACRSAGCQQLPRDVRHRARARVKALLRGQTP